MPCPSRSARQFPDGHGVPCPYDRLRRAFASAMDRAQSRLSNVSPTPPASLAGRRPRWRTYSSPIPLSPTAAASPTGTSCCTPPYPQPATPSPHSANFEFRFSSFELRNAKRETRRQSPLPQSASLQRPPPPDKTAPPHTAHSYPSAPRQASSARQPPQSSLPAAPRPAKTNNGCDNANARTRVPRSEREEADARHKTSILYIQIRVGNGKRNSATFGSFVLCGRSMLRHYKHSVTTLSSVRPSGLGPFFTAINTAWRGPGHRALWRNVRAARGRCRKRLRSSRSGLGPNRGRDSGTSGGLRRCRRVRVGGGRLRDLSRLRLPGARRRAA